MMERYGLSQRRACRLVGIDHSTLRYQYRRPDDTELRQRLRELAHQRRRFGYRRLDWLLAREGQMMNHKKLYRLISRGEADGAPARRTQTCSRNSGADDSTNRT
jgi:transposase InsO family protein